MQLVCLDVWISDTRYFLNILLDTTLGVAALWLTLRVLNGLALRAEITGIKSGFYGSPPKWKWLFKQSALYFIALLVMKLLVWFLFQIMPWLDIIADFLLSWSRGYPQVKVFFVTFVRLLLISS